MNIVNTLKQNGCVEIGGTRAELINGLVYVFEHEQPTALTWTTFINWYLPDKERKING